MTIIIFSDKLKFKKKNQTASGNAELCCEATNAEFQYYNSLLEPNVLCGHDAVMMLRRIMHIIHQNLILSSIKTILLAYISTC